MFRITFRDSVTLTHVVDDHQFPTENEAYRAGEAIASVMIRMQGIHPGAIDVVKVVEPLMGWTPDKGDQYALAALMGKGFFANTPKQKVPAIKFARMKSGAGLKEAKDWVEAHFE